ncbi:glycosyltransferase [Boseongicola aestuarii]|uniref:Putative glycosyltransferase EpsE n=1 Tax=Boseongicola aestuarii TaxID=1470561 RepID=A0A238J0X3_9RHOB|nr:glycosyltransferase [Boseongicola aestuarii]SMX23630.1 Putative glycosyltransferase EpsE [Boseongicola aestuarii]
MVGISTRHCNKNVEQMIASDIDVIVAIGPNEKKAHVEQALISLAQDGFEGKIRVYCCVDGNEDGEVLAYLRSLDSETFRVFVNEKNQGLAHSLNRLIDRILDESSAEFVARMDADDISMPDRFKKQVSYLQENPSISVLGSWLVEFDELEETEYLKKLATNSKNLEQWLFWRCPLNHPTVVFRRHVFENGYRYRSDLKMSQDYELWIRLVLDGYKIGNIPVPLLRFRRQQNFLNKRSYRKSWLEFKFKIRFLLERRQYYLTGYALSFARLLIGTLPHPVLKRLYRVSRIRMGH